MVGNSVSSIFGFFEKFGKRRFRETKTQAKKVCYLHHSFLETMSDKKGGGGSNSTTASTTNTSMTPAAITENVNLLMLQETIKTLEESKVRLLLTINELKEKLEQQKADQADIYYYLNKKCDESFEIIASLEEQLSNEQSDREIAEKMYESKIDELKSNNTAMELKMTQKIHELEGKVEMLNSYAQAKEEMDKQLQLLNNNLIHEQEEFRHTIDNLETKHILEKEKLRQSFNQQFDILKQTLEQSIDGKLSKKTQKTQIMNVLIRKELDAQSRHADRLLEINSILIEKDRKLKIEVDLNKSLQDEWMKKCANYQRKIQELEKNHFEHEQQQTSLQGKFDEDLKIKVSLLLLFFFWLLF
jgi:hypothetical protein